MKTKFVLWKVLLFTLPFFLYQCAEPIDVLEDDEAEVILKTSDFSGEKGKIHFRMTSSNFDFGEIEEAGGLLDAIYLRSVKTQGADPIVQIWDSVEVFNLLDMNAGIMVDIGFVPIPAGTYKQAIVNMKDAWVVYQGKEYKCVVPGGKMVLSFETPLVVTSQLSPDVLIDIDVSNSFVPVYKEKSKTKTGEKEPSYFIFKPIVRVMNYTSTGRMAGAVLTPDYELVEGALIELTDGVDTYQTYSLTDTVYDEFGIEYLPGYYSLNGVPAGDYTAVATLDGYVGLEQDVTIVEGNYTETYLIVIPQ